jgi:hypothetical protein
MDINDNVTIFYFLFYFLFCHSSVETSGVPARLCDLPRISSSPIFSLTCLLQQLIDLTNCINYC